MPDTAAAPMDPDGSRSPARISQLAAEALGTFLLVFGGAGSAIFAAQFPTSENTLGIRYLGVALAFGLTVVGAGYAVGHISGGHFNPAVTAGLFIAGKFPKIDAGPHIAAQILGGAIASSPLAVIVGGGPAGSFHRAHVSGFASNGFGQHSPGGYNLLAVNPVRSISTALYGGPAALGQVWVFILAPLAGAALAGYTYRTLFTRTMPDTPDH